jgi:hypothetical protein
MKKYSVSIQTNTGSTPLGDFSTKDAALVYARASRCGFEYAGDFNECEYAVITVMNNENNEPVYQRSFTL